MLGCIRRLVQIKVAQKREQKEEAEEQSKNLHIVQESVIGVEGDKRKPSDEERVTAEDTEKHATKSYKSEPI